MAIGKEKKRKATIAVFWLESQDCNKGQGANINDLDDFDDSDDYESCLELQIE